MKKILPFKAVMPIINKFPQIWKKRPIPNTWTCMTSRALSRSARRTAPRQASSNTARCSTIRRECGRTTYLVPTTWTVGNTACMRCKLSFAVREYGWAGGNFDARYDGELSAVLLFLCRLVISIHVIVSHTSKGVPGDITGALWAPSWSAFYSFLEISCSRFGASFAELLEYLVSADEAEDVNITRRKSPGLVSIMIISQWGFL